MSEIPASNDGRLTRNVNRTEMLETHNYWRQQVGVPPLTWSSELASYAQEWADRLADRGFEMQHRSQSPYGENIAWASGRDLSATEVVNMWAEERSDYNYETNSCRDVCGHYTQVVWRDTQEVGCGMATNGREEIWVCNYDPPGNYIGERPY
ncbi:pathogenesis-related family 1 protein [Baaleninema sp.]|uniref:pathogenesis-related family 1 protein n=1 Tax=Baaleninema sp. TaxID=3101197 RepID=UPI003D08EBB1